MFVDVPPTQSCPRYFSHALERAETREIDLTWSGPRSLSVAIAGFLEWDVELGSTLATRVLNILGRTAPRWFWRSPVALGAMGRPGGLSSQLAR
jgi:hypothetical protein